MDATCCYMHKIHHDVKKLLRLMFEKNFQFKSLFQVPHCFSSNRISVREYHKFRSVLSESILFVSTRFRRYVAFPNLCLKKRCHCHYIIFVVKYHKSRSVFSGSIALISHVFENMSKTVTEWSRYPPAFRARLRGHSCIDKII